MTEYLTDADLASFLKETLSAVHTSVVARTNALIDETWANPTDPVPEWVKNIAWDVAIRAATNPRGLTSETRSWDDLTKTVRWESGTVHGVRLTAEERIELEGSGSTTTSAPARSIRMSVPGWNTSCRF